MIPSTLDLALLKADATRGDLEKLCAEAKRANVNGVLVNGSRVIQARHWLDESQVKTLCAIAWPLGAMDADAKRYEVEAALDAGAQGFEMVINLGRFKDGDDAYVLRELRDVVEAADERPVKVILETCLLTQVEKTRACQLVVESGARFVKTSTGFSAGGATVADVRLLRETVGPQFGVKASGGIRDAKTALEMIAAGATRLGTSAGIAIVKGLEETKAGSY